MTFTARFSPLFQVLALSGACWIALSSGRTGLELLVRQRVQRLLEAVERGRARQDYRVLNEATAQLLRLEVELPPEAGAVLVELLEEQTDAENRYLLLDLISRLGGESAADALGRYLAAVDDDPGRQLEISRVFGALAFNRSDRAFEVLRDEYRRGYEPWLVWVVQALGRQDRRLELESELRGLLDSPLPAVRLLAVQIFDGSDDPRTLSAIIRRVAEETEPGIRAELLRALGASRSERALPILIGGLEDSDRRVQEAAIRALTRVGSRDGALELRKYVGRTPSGRLRTLAQRAVDDILGDE